MGRDYVSVLILKCPLLQQTNSPVSFFFSLFSFQFDKYAPKLDNPYFRHSNVSLTSLGGVFVNGSACTSYAGFQVTDGVLVHSFLKLFFSVLVLNDFLFFFKVQNFLWAVFIFFFFGCFGWLFWFVF